MGTHPIFESDFDCLTERIRRNMSDFEDAEFETAGSGAALVYPKQCSALRKSEFVMIKGKACKIVDMSTSKTGKHGHAKVHMVALDIFDGKKLEDICPSTHNMECPIVKRTEYQLIDIDEEGYCSLMDDTVDTRDDLKSNDPELEKEIRDKVEAGEDALVCVLSAIGREMIMSIKKNSLMTPVLTIRTTGKSAHKSSM